MKSKIKRVATLLMIFAVVTAGFGAAFAGSAAAETTTLAGDGSDQVTGFNASADDHLETSVAADGTDFDTDGSETLHMNVSYDGNEYAVMSEDVTDGTSASQTLNLSHAELEKLPGDAGENTTITVTTWGEDANGDVATATNEFTVDLEFADTHAVRTIHSSDDTIVSDFEVADDEDDGLFSSFNFWSSSTDKATIEDEIGIAGSQTDVHVYSEDEDVTEVFDSQLEDAEDGDRVGMMMSSSANDGVVYVFANEPGEKITGDEVDPAEDTYIVANEGGEYDVNLGEDYDGEETVDLSLTAGEKFDRSALQNDLGYSMFQAWGLDFGSLSSFDWLPF